MILKRVASVLSPGGQDARLSILIFHRVLSQKDSIFPFETDARRFDQILSWIGGWFQVMPLDDAVARLATGTLPARAVAITFDDGYADNATIALPILQRHGMVATFFVATSFLDGGRMWNDTVIESVRAYAGKVLDLSECGLGTYSLGTPEQQRDAIGALLQQIKYLEPVQRREAVEFVQRSVNSSLPDDLMMTSSQVVQLRRAGMQIGAHTCSHPILASISDVDAMHEIRGSKETLQSLLQEPVNLFAYPNGKPGKDYLAKHAMMVKQAEFTAAVSTSAGVSSANTDRFQLARFSPWDIGKLRYGARMMLNLRNINPMVAQAVCATIPARS
jgi:peptidoglycan/xylan/chitin deacetylase (PgdA/CDA1 family)